MRKKRDFSYRTAWPPERVEGLVSLWDQGLTGTQVANALGGGLTRCAVLGKLWRLGIKRDWPMPRYSPPPSSLPKRIPPLEGIDLLDLLPRSCRWPEGNRPPYSFCGAPQAEGMVYCIKHATLAYRHVSTRI